MSHKVTIYDLIWKWNYTSYATAMLSSYFNAVWMLRPAVWEKTWKKSGHTGAISILST